MGDNQKFEKLVNRLPFSWERILGMGLRYFLDRQEPEQVNFTVHNNGWSIDVKTTDEKVEDALDFWENNIGDKL